MRINRLFLLVVTFTLAMQTSARDISSRSIFDKGLDFQFSYDNYVVVHDPKDVRYVWQGPSFSVVPMSYLDLSHWARLDLGIQMKFSSSSSSFGINGATNRNSINSNRAWHLAVAPMVNFNFVNLFDLGFKYYIYEKFYKVENLKSKYQFPSLTTQIGIKRKFSNDVNVGLGMEIGVKPSTTGNAPTPTRSTAYFLLGYAF